MRSQRVSHESTAEQQQNLGSLKLAMVEAARKIGSGEVRRELDNHLKCNVIHGTTVHFIGAGGQASNQDYQAFSMCLVLWSVFQICCHLVHPCLR